jgi:hypothetical protein
VNKLPFARDRLFESYFWAFAVYFEPEYHLARMITCKFVAMITIVDDIYDVYGTYEELELFTEAVERFKLIGQTISLIGSYVISSFKIT